MNSLPVTDKTAGDASKEDDGEELQQASEESEQSNEESSDGKSESVDRNASSSSQDDAQELDLNSSMPQSLAVALLSHHSDLNSSHLHALLMGS